MKKRVINNWEDLPVLLDIEYLAILLNVSEITARRMAERGEIKGKKVGHKWIFDKEYIQNKYSQKGDS